MFCAQVSVSARCVKCGARRAVPEANRSRWPATDKSGAVTLNADEACGCGSRRIKLTVRIK